MRNLKDSIPWFTAILAGAFPVTTLFIVGVAGLVYHVAWANALGDEYIIAFLAVLAAVPLFLLGFCVLRRKWILMLMSMSAFLASIFGTVMITFFAVVGLMTD